MRFLTLALIAPSLVHALEDLLPSGEHYPPEVPTFDPEEYFKDKQLDRPTLTAYRACPPKGPLISNWSTPQLCNSTWLSNSALPVPRFSDIYWYTDTYRDLIEKLTWKRANTEYPLLIGLEVVGRGTSRMEREYPGNTQDIRVDVATLAKTMNFTGLWNQTFARNMTADDKKAMIYGQLGLSVPLRFTIGQPKDPRWKDDKDTDGGRIVDAGTPFYLDQGQRNIMEMAVNRDRIAEDNWNSQEKKWKMGVGIGVGVGVPVLMIASYIAGRHMGKKKNPEAVALKEVNR